MNNNVFVCRVREQQAMVLPFLQHCLVICQLTLYCNMLAHHCQSRKLWILMGRSVIPVKSRELLPLNSLILDSIYSNDFLLNLIWLIYRYGTVLFVHVNMIFLIFFRCILYLLQLRELRNLKVKPFLLRIIVISSTFDEDCRDKLRSRITTSNFLFKHK